MYGPSSDLQSGSLGVVSLVRSVGLGSELLPELTIGIDNGHLALQILAVLSVGILSMLISPLGSLETGLLEHGLILSRQAVEQLLGHDQRLSSVRVHGHAHIALDLVELLIADVGEGVLLGLAGAKLKSLIQLGEGHVGDNGAGVGEHGAQRPT